MIPIDEFLKHLDDAIREYPRAEEWFETDEELEAWCKGDKTMQPKKIVYAKLRLPEAVIELYPRTALFDGCFEIAEKHGCKLRVDGDDWVISKPLA